MKYCEDCKWLNAFNAVNGVPTKLYLCDNEFAFYRGEDFVMKASDLPAKWARQWGPCGLEGKLWEGKDVTPNT
jgi:hypothetical protein